MMTATDKIIAAAAEAIVTTALAEVYVEAVVRGDLEGYGLLSRDIECLTTVQAAIEEAVAERFHAAAISWACTAALSGSAAAVRYLADHDALRDSAVEAAALRRLSEVIEDEVEALREGQALVWDSDVAARYETVDDDGRVALPDGWRLSDRDYLAARIDGDIDAGVLPEGTILDSPAARAGAVFDWWVEGVGHTTAIIDALGAGDSALTVLAIDGEVA